MVQGCGGDYGVYWAGRLVVLELHGAIVRALGGLGVDAYGGVASLEQERDETAGGAAADLDYLGRGVREGRLDERPCGLQPDLPSRHAGIVGRAEIACVPAWCPG